MIGAPGRGSVLIGRFDLRTGTLDLSRLELPEAGAVRIDVFYAGYVAAEGQEIRIEDLFGRDPRGEPPAFERLGGETGAWRSDADGAVYIDDLAPGVYVIGLEDGGDEAQFFTILVRPGEVTEVVLWAPW